MAGVGFRTTLLLITTWSVRGERPEYHENNALEVQTERSEAAKLQRSESPESTQAQQQQLQPESSARRPSLGDKLMAKLPVYAPLTGSRCRCLYEEFTCAVDEHWMSRAADNAPMGFCDVQPRREAFDEALQGLPSGSVPWSPELQSKVATLEDRTNALVEYLMPLGLQNPSAVQEEPAKNIGQKNHIAHDTLVYFTHRIAVARGVISSALKVISDKHAADAQVLEGLRSHLQAAIEGDLVSNLDNAIAEAEAAEEPARLACQGLLEAARLRKTQVLQQIGDMKSRLEAAIQSDRIKDLDAALEEAAAASGAVQRACEDSAEAARLRKTQLLQQVEELKAHLQNAIDSNHIKDLDAALAEAETANVAVQEACQESVEAARLRKNQLQQQIGELESRLDAAIQSDRIQDLDTVLTEAENADVAVRGACQESIEKAKFRRDLFKEQLRAQLAQAEKLAGAAEVDLKQAVEELNTAKTGLESVGTIQSGFTKSADEVQENIDQLEGEVKQLMETAAA